MGVFKQLWEVYKERGCELTLHRAVVSQLGGGASASMGASASDSGDALAVDAFLAEMEVYLAASDMFLLMLSVGMGGMFETQSSFVGLLLREDVVQARIIDLLLEKLSDAASESEASAMEKNIPKLILREIRWIDHVVDSRELVEKLVSALPAFPIALQRDIIYILPEIASDEDAYAVIDAMLELIRSEAELVVCCIEALGNFNVANEQTSEVVRCVLERLDSSPLVDLPVIVKYLVQEAPGADVELIASELRDKLSATLSFVDNTGDATNSSGGRRSSGATAANASGTDARTGNEEALVLGSIIQGFYFREDILKAFMSGISKCGEGGGAGGMKLLDVWVLMAAHSIPRDRVKLEKTFKSKVSAGIITRGLLVRSVRGHANALRSYFPSLLQLANVLIVQQTNPTCMAMGSLFYELLFEEFSLCQRDGKSEAAYYQGEIVNSLLGFCLSASGSTTDAAFRTFLALMSPQVSFQAELRGRKYEQSHFKRRFRFQLFLPLLRQMLDAIEMCSLEQVRHIYDILFAVGGPDDTELCNTLRKQTCHQEVRYRLCGIIGSVARGNRLLLQFREDAERLSEDVDKQAVADQVETQFKNSIVEMFERTQSQGSCMAFLLEEVRRWMKGLAFDDYSKILIDTVSDYAMDALSTNFMSEFNVTRARAGEYRSPVLGGAFKSDLWFSLDDAQSLVYLKVMDLASSPNVRDQESLHYMSALAEVVLECARKTGNLKTVDCILVCPIQMMETSVIEDIAGMDDTVQNAICSTIWHSINWLRSIIGFYAHEAGRYHQAKVVERLRNLVYLESLLLDDLVGACLHFGPPGMHFSDANRVSAPKSLGVAKKRGRPSKGSQVVDRSDLVRKSFNPVRADALKILSGRRLWTSLQKPPSATSASPSDVVRPETIVECLLMMFEEFVRQAQAAIAKNTDTSPLLMTFSETFKWTQDSENALPTEGEQVTTTQAPTDADNNSMATVTAVLQAACKYADHFLHVLQKISEDTDEEVADDGVFMQRVAKRVLLSYLNIGAMLFVNTKAVERATKTLPAQLCQEYFLLSEHQVTLQTDSESSIKDQVLESCFMAANKFSCLVNDDMELATMLLRTVAAISSVSHGFPASQVAQRALTIDFKPAKDGHGGNEMDAKISAMALTFLQHDWSGGDKKFVYKNANLDVFLGSYFNHSKLILDNVEKLAIEGFLALLENSGTDVPDYPTLTKKTLPSFHRAMFDALVVATARLDFDSDGVMTKPEVKLLLNYLSQAVLLFKLLVGLTKCFQKPTVVANVLKIGRKFVELIVRAMPFLQRHFVDHNELVMKIIAEVQIATRRIQVLCAHGKLIKDGTAAAQVPTVKRLLERFIYLGEELARSHGVLSAFTTGVLKNKRIDGTTISKAELQRMEDPGSDSGSGSESEGGNENASEEEDNIEGEEEEEEEGESEAEAAAEEHASSTEDEETKENNDDRAAARRPQKKRR